MLEDRAKLEAFRAGDREVLAEVFRCFLPMVARLARYGFSFSSGCEVHRFNGFKNDYEQQDLIQEVFSRAFSDGARSSYQGISPYGSYLTGIARHIVIDMFRCRSARLQVFDTDVVDRAKSEEGANHGPEQNLGQQEIEKVIQLFVDDLNLIERDFVELRYRGGLKQEEVARRMKVRRSRVRTLEKRVRRKLEKRLARQGLIEQPQSWLLMASVAVA